MLSENVFSPQMIGYDLIFGAGWERMVLQILFLGPSNLLEPNASFAQMSQKLIVSPIVKTLVFSKVPEKVNNRSENLMQNKNHSIN